MFEELSFSKPKSAEDQDFLPLFPLTDENGEDPKGSYPESLPLVALKNTVLFPGIVIPITVGRDKSLNAIKTAYEGDRLIGVLSQKDSEIEDPSSGDLYHVGTVARLVKLLENPDGKTTALLQGRKRFELRKIEAEDPYLKGRIHILEHEPVEDEMEFEAMISSIRDLAKKIIELSPQIPTEAVMMLQKIENNSSLINFIASNLNIDLEEKQKLLTIDNLIDKGERVIQHMNHELQMLEIKDNIESKVKTDIEKQQRDYFLNQQLKTIQEELGKNPQKMQFEELEERAKEKKWPDHVQEAFEKELNKLKRINPQVAEYSLTINYLELLLDLPWNETSDDNFNLSRAKRVLDEDHYALEKVKERILEHLAVLKLKGDMKAPIICLVGPPGVGKTSLGRSVARALNREFVRMSLGGLHDESEIRGHRKTYIGALPGRIIQSIQKAGTSNPVFILDEVDKIGKDFRGDPSSALLEVLDPEQNSTFYDNYLELEYDLSKVLFIGTANTLNSIQPALKDRMEIIEINGYSMEEKVEIAKRHLIPDQLEAHGLTKKQIQIRKPTIEALIRRYTRESGVRSLNRMLASLMRHVARKVAMEEDYDVIIKMGQLRDILGPEKVNPEDYAVAKVPGVAVGLAWTSAGGDILFIESALSDGKGELTLTGNLGDVMKESASTALSFVKAHGESLGIPAKKFGNKDVHIHVPKGSIPKDGPSAGVTMLTSIASVFTGRKVKPYLAMTGEITLRGKVLPVGGIKEKVLAAKRSGVKEVLLSEENRKHVEEIELRYVEDLDFKYVERMDEVLDYALDS